MPKYPDAHFLPLSWPVMRWEEVSLLYKTKMILLLGSALLLGRA